MKHPVMISMAFLCVLLLPGLALAQEGAPMFTPTAAPLAAKPAKPEMVAETAQSNQGEQLMGNAAPLLAQAQVPPGTPEEGTPEYERRFKEVYERETAGQKVEAKEERKSPRSRLPTQFPPSEEIQALDRAERQRVEMKVAQFQAHMEAMDLADKKPPLSVPLSAEGIAHIRVRRASSSGVGSYLSCTETYTGLSGNLAASDIASAIASGLEKVCQAIDRVVDKVSEFPSEYDLFLSLKKPLMGVSVLRWQASTLDDAMTIIRSVQEGRIESAMIRTHWPKKEPEPDSKPIKYELEPCKECHVKEWVFRVSGKK